MGQTLAQFRAFRGPEDLHSLVDGVLDPSIKWALHITSGYTGRKRGAFAQIKSGTRSEFFSVLIEANDLHSGCPD